MMHRYIEDTATFDPDALAAMSTAFANTCNALRIFSGDERGREAVAVRIIELARGGILDAGALSQRVLNESRASA